MSLHMHQRNDVHVSIHLRRCILRSIETFKTCLLSQHISVLAIRLGWLKSPARQKPSGQACQRSFSSIEHLELCAVQVRKICCACLVKLYRKGDTLPLYARVSSLQGFLSTKEVPVVLLHRQPV